MSDSADQQPQRPWASPRQIPVKGIVQPRILPPFGKPTRHTNRLDYIMTTVLKEASKHKHVWPFLKPVDALSLCIPLYHDRITRPMDLKTIENRLKNTYYTCAQECIDDIETVFNNCYVFNGKEDDVTIMAQNVHEVIKKSMENAPREEHDMDIYWGKNKKKTKAASSTADKKKEIRGPSEPRSECGSESSAKAERKVAGKKTGKRKVDSDDEEKQETIRVKREVTVKKEVTHPITPAMKPCQKIINEFLGKKYNEFSWPFHDPVDAEKLGLHDYHKIITEPMDLRTIKGRVETGHYKEPTDFEKDIRLMFNNCFTYNPSGDPIHQLGRRLLEIFDKKWSDLDGSNANSRASSIAPSGPSASTAPAKAKTSTTTREIKKEPKEVVENPGSKSEDLMQLTNALSIVEEREEKLKSELQAVSNIKEKLLKAKNRREENSNEPFPSRLITEAKSLCTPQSSKVPIAGVAPKNGRGRRPSTVKTHGYDFDSDDEENKKEMSYEDKRNLSMLINRLPPTQLSTIIAIIQRRENNAIDQDHQPDSEIEIDFESLGDMCLREMDAFVRSVLNVKKTDGDAKNATGDSAADKSGKSKKKKNFNMSESSDDETTNSRKRRKKDTSESESSSSSDDDSDDDTKNIPRKSGQPPSSREWNTAAPPPRTGGMGGQPPMARVPPAVPVNKLATSSASSSYQATKAPSNSRLAKPQEKTTLGVTSKNTEKPPPKRNDTAGKSILDSLLPDSFGSSQVTNVPLSSSIPTTSAAVASQSTEQANGCENGENEEERIQRLRAEAKRRREREDENNGVSMAAQMEVMSAFEFDNIY